MRALLTVIALAACHQPSDAKHKSSIVVLEWSSCPGGAICPIGRDDYCTNVVCHGHPAYCAPQGDDVGICVPITAPPVSVP